MELAGFIGGLRINTLILLNILCASRPFDGRERLTVLIVAML
jgi:hypothetical protein